MHLKSTKAEKRTRLKQAEWEMEICINSTTWCKSSVLLITILHSLHSIHSLCYNIPANPIVIKPSGNKPESEPTTF